jgi:hypothetical protein
MESKIAAQSSVFASGMLMPTDSSFGHHSSMEGGQVGNNVNQSAFQVV